MGAEPRLALLSLALPAGLPLPDFDAMVGGLARLAARYRVHVVGGNLTRSPGPLVVDVTVAGTVKRRQALTRSGARPGDALYVTGTIGGAAVGLELLQGARPSPDTSSAACIERYLCPEPRVRCGVLLARNQAATACMDLSDGLADAVRQVAAASGVGALVEAALLPLDSSVKARGDRDGTGPAALAAWAVSRGDDYELLFSVAPRRAGRLVAARRHGGVPLTRIGVCTPATEGIRLRHAAGDSPMPFGYNHFG
jgi:thiamine-monophosphate kinase